MSHCVVQAIAVCLYVQILLLAQSADTLYMSLWRLQFASLLYHTLCSGRDYFLLSRIKASFRELLFSVSFGHFILCLVGVLGCVCVRIFDFYLYQIKKQFCK